MGKYFVVNEDSGLHADYFAWKGNHKKILDAIEKVREEFGIETKQFYLDQKRLHIHPSENDSKKFKDMMKKGGWGEFKKNSEPSKMWVELVKDILQFKKPQLFYYFDMLGHRWRERLFDIDGKLYGSIESDQEVKMPDFVTEIKASEFYKIIEDYEERCKS